jgi:hypothetical protein
VSSGRAFFLACVLRDAVGMRTDWTTRAENSAYTAAVREILLAAFPGAEEAGLADALRADSRAWIDVLRPPCPRVLRGTADRGCLTW